MDFWGINEPQKIKKIKKNLTKNSTRFKSPNQIPFSLRRDLNSPVSIPSSIPFRSTRPRWQFGNKHARILARGSGSRRPNLRLKWKIGDGKIGRRHPSKQISFVPGKNSLSLANDSWSMRRRDSLRAQTNRFCAPPRGSISLFSFPRVEVGRIELSRFIGREWKLGSIAAAIDKCLGERGQRHLDTQASKRVAERKEWSFRKVALHFISSRTNVDLLEKFHLGPISYPRKRPLSCKQPRCSRILLR